MGTGGENPQMPEGSWEQERSYKLGWGVYTRKDHVREQGSSLCVCVCVCPWEEFTGTGQEGREYG